MDDLESNPLYKTFLTKSKREFDIACKMSYLITIPHSDSLDNVTIDQFFANSHILMPSKLLKMHYTPLQAGQIEDIEEIDCNKLIVYIGKKKPQEKIVINILAQEIGYNVYNREFRTLLIDRPLIPQDLTRNFIRSMFSSPALYSTTTTSSSSTTSTPYASLRRNENSQQNLNKRIKPPKPFLNHDDCVKYLEFISQEVTVQLENDVKKLQSKYMFLSHYLDDAALRIKSLAELYLPKYEYQLLHYNNNNNNFINDNNNFFYFITNINSYNSKSDLICDSSNKKSINLAVENYIVHLLHGKIITSLYQCYEKEDRILVKKFQLIQKYQLTICQLGAQEAFSDFSVTEDILQTFRRLPSLQSPLAMVSCLMKIVQLITESLNQSVRFKSMIGGGGGKKNKLNSYNNNSQIGINDQDVSLLSTSTDFESSLTNQNLNNSSISINQSHCSPTSESATNKVTICSDDLIASFVYTLAQSKPPNLFSTSKYLELFGFSSNAKEQAAYYTATFQIVIQYIFNFYPEEQHQIEFEKQRTQRYQEITTNTTEQNNTNRTILLVEDNNEKSREVSCDNLVYSLEQDHHEIRKTNESIIMIDDQFEVDEDFDDIYVDSNGPMPLRKSQSLFVMNSLDSRESALTE